MPAKPLKTGGSDGAQTRDLHPHLPTALAGVAAQAFCFSVIERSLHELEVAGIAKQGSGNWHVLDGGLPKGFGRPMASRRSHRGSARVIMLLWMSATLGVIAANGLGNVARDYLGTFCAVSGLLGPFRSHFREWGCRRAIGERLGNWEEKWSERGDLNSRPPVPQSGTLCFSRPFCFLAVASCP